MPKWLLARTRCEVHNRILRFAAAVFGQQQREDEQEDAAGLLVSTEWHWNGWRNVKFHAPRRGSFAKFYAPTQDCESGLCSWHANQTGVFIMWGDAGLHRLRLQGRARLAGDGAGSIVRSATDGVKGRKK